MHGLHSRYPEEKNKMIALNHKLLEQVKVVFAPLSVNSSPLLVSHSGYGLAIKLAHLNNNVDFKNIEANYRQLVSFQSDLDKS